MVIQQDTHLLQMTIQQDQLEVTINHALFLRAGHLPLTGCNTAGHPPLTDGNTAGHTPLMVQQ
jgi:hypothetical protein